MADVRCIRALDTQHLGPCLGRKLYRCLPHLPVCTQHEDDVALFHATRPLQSFEGGNEGDADRARLLHGQIDRFGTHAAHGHGEIAGMRAVAPDTQLAAATPHFLAEHLLRPLDNNAGVIPTRRARPHRMRHEAQHSLHVARIHRGTHHAHETLGKLDVRRILRANVQIERVDIGALFQYTNCFHFLFS